MSKLQTRITRIHVTPDTIFNERAFSVEIVDEGGGEYLVIRNDSDQLAIDDHQWPAMRDAIDLMVRNVRTEK